MPLDSSLYTQLKTNIDANTAVMGFGPFAASQVKDVPNSNDGNVEVAKWYNLAASPAFTIWRKAVPMSEIAKKINGAELGGLTTGNHTRLQTIITLLSVSGGADPSLADQRAFWDDIFSGAGGTNTRTALLVLWKKLATRAQKLFSTGTGSDASPATTSAVVGELLVLTGNDVENARNS